MQSANLMYEKFEKLRDLTRLELIEDSNTRVEYHKMIQTGNLEFHDYGTGFLNFEVYTCPVKYNPLAYPSAPDNYWFIRIWIANIDDGDLGAWSKPIEMDKAISNVRQISNYIQYMTSFPSLDELNINLRKFGLTVCHE
jgi:hypothetical protein